MGRVTELRVRADWGIVRAAYLPLLVAALAVVKFLPWAANITLRAAPCAVCFLLARWFNHVEESVGQKPLLQITERGLICEDGEEPVEYAWADITGVVMHRRNNIPPWRTNGSTDIGPPFWLAICVRDPDYKPDDGAVFAVGQGYAERSRRPEGGVVDEEEGMRVINVWPRQVVGGLFSLMRFAKELQAQLLVRCERGEFPCLVPSEQAAAE